ncbi:MAG TPA: hypothetical protein VJR29_07815 [bacterium]|nr:hypothetical protein [bacterium]
MAESDPELFYKGLLRVAGREQQAGHESNAALLYQGVAQLAAGETVELAKRRLAVLNDGGQMGDRAEYLLSRFVSEVTDPAPLLAMGAAGLAFRVARGAALARLLELPSGALTRGAAARALAGVGGFAAEVPVFSAATRTAQAALGHDLDWSAAALKGELSHSFLFLGAIKTVGAAGRSLQRSIGAGPRGSAALAQASLFGGIYAGQALEEAAGFRPPRGGATALVDSLGLFLTFNAAGRLSRSLLGSRFAAWERELDLRSEILGRQGPSLMAPGLSMAVATTGTNGVSSMGATRDFFPSAVQMTNGSRGDLPRLPPIPRPSSSYPPRSSDIFPNGKAPGIIKVAPPPEQIQEILSLLLPHQSVDPEALVRAGRLLNWLMPDDRHVLIRHALEAATPDVIVNRLTAMATQSKDRSTAVHALRLLLILQTGDKKVEYREMLLAMETIGKALSPRPASSKQSDSSEKPEVSAALRWNVRESRFCHALDGVITEAGQRRSTLAFEMELGHLVRGGFSSPLLDNLLHFSLELRSPKARYTLANSLVWMAWKQEAKRGPIREFMVGYYLVDRLVETGNLTQAAAASRFFLTRSQNWEKTAFPKDFRLFLRERLAFQEATVAKYADVLKNAHPQGMHEYYELHAFGDRHLPEPWGLISGLRDHAALLEGHRGGPAKEAVNRRLQVAATLMRDMVLDPLISKALHASPQLSFSRQGLLDLVEDLPARSRVESQEPLQAIFNALISRGEWSEAYRLLDAVYHMQVADPMLLRQVHASMVMELDIAQHRAAEKPEYGLLEVHMKRFNAFESRFF